MYLQIMRRCLGIFTVAALVSIFMVGATNAQTNTAPTAEFTIVSPNLYFEPNAAGGSLGNVVVSTGVTVTLDARSSSDPEGDSLIYAWVQFPLGTTVALSSNDTAVVTFLAPSTPQDQLIFNLTVTDPSGLSDSGNGVVVVVDDTSGRPPIANAGPDRTVGQGFTVTLAGSGSDPTPAIDAPVLTYAWTQTSGMAVTLSNADTATPAFTAPSGLPADVQLVFALAVARADGIKMNKITKGGRDTVTVTVTATVANAGPDQTVDEGATVTLAGSGSDPTPAIDAPVLTYAWTQTSGMAVTLSNADTATPAFTAPSGLPADVQLMFTLTVTATGGGLSGVDSMTVTVNASADGTGPGPEEPAIVIDPLQLSVKHLTVVLGETREVVISDGIPPYRASLFIGDAATTRVNDTTLRVTGASVGQARLRIRDSSGKFATLRVWVTAPPVLNPEADDGSATEAVFRGGASSDGGDNYFKDGAFSVGEALDVIFVITPRTADAGEQAGVVIAARMESAPESVWLLTESGLLPYDGETLAFFKEGLTLEANNFINLTLGGPVTLSPAEVGSWELFIGYQLADGALFYHPEPLRIEIVE